MRGTKPKPTALQIAQGDPRKLGKNKLQEKLMAEPSATRGLPDCPRHLRGRARAAWNFWRAELIDMKLDCRPDAMMLEGACVNFARAVEADLIVTKQGMMVTESTLGEDGEVIVLKIRAHPAIVFSNAAWRQVRAFCAEFGLSPVSRTRLAVDRNDKVDDLVAILSAPREARGARMN